MTVSEARRRLFPLIREVNEDSTTVEILDKDGNAAYLVPAAEYRSMQETAYLLRSPANAARLLESLEQLRAGRGTQHDLLDDEPVERPSG